MRRPLRGERGAVLAWAGLMLLMLLAFAVVAVDVGRLAFTANEVQSVADVAATAGATAVYEGNDAVAQAQHVVALNTVDGAPASIAAGDVILGNYDESTGTFTAGATPTNAVRANAMATVSNILAMVLGTPQTTVAKTSTAVVTAVQNGTPTLPLAIGECQFDGLCSTCLPHLTQTPNEDNNTAWTGFFGGRSRDSILSFLSASCGGGGADVPELKVGDSISLNDSPYDPSHLLLQAVQCQVAAGQRDFVIPVVGEEHEHGSEDDDDSHEGDGDDDSHSDDGGDDHSGDDDSHSDGGEGDECEGSLNYSGEVVGFVTVHVDSVVVDGWKKGINMHGIFNASMPGTPGGNCDNCGTGHAVIVN